ncbi:reverse transcriptase domain-containing protein [Tanacetum coccineum]
MSNAAIERMIVDRVDAAIAVKQTSVAAKAAEIARTAAAAETTRAAATAGGAGGSNNTGPAAGAGGPNVVGLTVGAVVMNAVPEVKGFSYKEFIPTNFKGAEGAVRLTRWFERSESVFLINKCVENDKVKYATSTLLDEALSWWNSVAQPIGIENACKIPWVELKKIMIKQYCSRSEVQKFHGFNHKEVIGKENAKGYATAAAAPAGGRGYAGNLPLCNRCKLYHTCPCTIKCKNYQKCPQNNGQQQQGGARGKVYVLGDKNAQQDPNVVMGTFLLNNHYAKNLFDSGADKSFVSTAFASLLNITPTTLDTAFTIGSANGKLVNTNTVIQNRTLNFLNHPLKIDLMPIELGSFDVIIGME